MQLKLELKKEGTLTKTEGKIGIPMPWLVAHYTNGRKTSPMDITDLENKIVHIENYQATFLTLKLDKQIIRFNIIDKKEFRLKKGISGPLKVYDNHPLLFDYNENIWKTYINSSPKYFDDFISDFENAISETTEGWRNWTNYVQNKNLHFTIDRFLNNVKNGAGLLLEAPHTITQKAVDVCNNHLVATKSFGNEKVSNHYKLLLIENNYIIAKNFILHNKQE